MPAKVVMTATVAEDGRLHVAVPGRQPGERVEITVSDDPVAALLADPEVADVTATSAYGMWAGRDDMVDGVAWVNSNRGRSRRSRRATNEGNVHAGGIAGA